MQHIDSIKKPTIMKRLIPIFLILCITSLAAQQKADRFTTATNPESQRNKRSDLMNFVPNEVLIKFKDEVTVTNGSRIKAAGVNAVDKLLQSYGVNALEKLFPAENKPIKRNSY